MIDAIIEFSLVSDSLAWLSGRASESFEVANRGSIYSLHGRPAHEYSSPIYTSLAAALAAFILIGLGGILCFSLQSRPNLWRQRWAHVVYTLWIVLLNWSAALTLGALTYTWIANDKNNGGSIDLDELSQGKRGTDPSSIVYPVGSWTPEHWLNAVLQLDLVHAADRDDIARQLAVLRGWRINLMPLFIVGLVVSIFGHWDAVQRRNKLKKSKMTTNDNNQATEITDGGWKGHSGAS